MGTLNSEQVTRWVDINQENDAHGLLETRCPGATKKFFRIMKKLEDLRQEVAKEFPDANYYLASGTMCLMLGHPQEGMGLASAHQERIGASKIFKGADGGDW